LENQKLNGFLAGNRKDFRLQEIFTDHPLLGDPGNLVSLSSSHWEAAVASDMFDHVYALSSKSEVPFYQIYLTKGPSISPF
jgi:hypothetical protein